MTVSLYCLNVGQANSLVLLAPLAGGRPNQFQAVVIDVGVDGSELARWLRGVGVQALPLILLTHNDKDHIFGLDGLVHGFRKRVGQIRFVIDRDPNDIPFWVSSQTWKKEGIVKDVDEVRVPTAASSLGLLLLDDAHNGYQLYCLYPTVFQNQAAVAGAKTVGSKPRKGVNTSSAVLGLATSAHPKKWRVLFGGDLHLSGWRSLVAERRLLLADVLIAPHHGAPQEATKQFGYAELADAIRPNYALISVGTVQKDYGHPLPDLVTALQALKATILCTQLTQQCVKKPDAVANRSVMPLAMLTDPTHLAQSGTACAGTVAVVIQVNRPPTVLRVDEHQAAVNALKAAGHKPLCRS